MVALRASSEELGPQLRINSAAPLTRNQPLSFAAGQAQTSRIASQTADVTANYGFTTRASAFRLVWFWLGGDAEIKSSAWRATSFRTCTIGCTTGLRRGDQTRAEAR